MKQHHSKFSPGHFLINHKQIINILTFSFIFSYFLIGQNLQAKWWFVDDHEIFNFLGEDHRLTIAEFIPTLLSTEVGQYGQALRYRPGYYFLKLSETMIFRDNPFLWYLFSYLVLSVSMSITLYLISLIVPIWLAIVAILFIFTGNYWADIFTRLGPSEIYAVLGCSLFSLGYYGLIKHPTKLNWLWQLLLLIGFCIAVGVKENFLILLLPCLYLFIYLFYKHRITPLLIVSLLIIIAFSLLVSSSILLATSKAGYGMYMTNTNYTTRLLTSLNSIKPFILSYPVIVWIIGSFILITVNHFFHKDKFSQIIHLTLISGFIMVNLLIVYGSQTFFYNGIYPTQSRYDFPGMLAPTFVIFTVIWYFMKIINLFIKKKYWPWVTTICVLILLFSALHRGYDTIRLKSYQNVERTTRFTNYIQNLVNYLKTQPDADIVFVVRQPASDIEMVVSLARYLRYYHIRDNLFIYNDFNPQALSGIELENGQLLINLAKGNSIINSLNGPRFNDINSLRNGQCLIIYGSPIVTLNCQRLEPYAP